MRRRLATLAAAATFALAFGVTPALADSRGDGRGDGNADQWVVTRYTQDVTGMSVTCGGNTYTVTSGTEDFLGRFKGSIDSVTGVALTPGQATEAWTLDNVRVVDQHDRSHRVTGFQRMDSAWLAGANLNGTSADLFTRGTWVVTLHVEGTHDGFSYEQRLFKDGTVRVETSGTCPNPFV